MCINYLKQKKKRIIILINYIKIKIVRYLIQNFVFQFVLLNKYKQR